MVNPWVLLGAGGMWLASLVGAYRFGVNHEQGAEALIKATVQETREAAQRGAAAAISEIEVQRVEITQPIVREVRTRTVYADCRHTPDGLRGVNAAITGRAEPAGSRELPAADAARR